MRRYGWFILGVSLWAQTPTKTNVSQLQAPSSQAMVLVVIPGAGAAWAKLDATLALDTSGPVPVLKAPPQAQGTPALEVNYPSAAQASFSLMHTPNSAVSLRVYRNGLRQALGADYMVSGSTVTFSSGNVPQAGDAIIFEYTY